MTQDDFLKSLSLDQSAALVVFRDAIGAGRDVESAKLAAIHKEGMDAKDTIVKSAQDALTTANTERDAALAALAKKEADQSGLVAAAVAALSHAETGNLDPIKEVVAAAQTPAVERQKAELDAQIAALQANRNALG